MAEPRPEVKRLLDRMNQMFTFDPALNHAAYAEWERALAPLTARDLERVGDLVVANHKYKTAPRPAQVLEWLRDAKVAQNAGTTLGQDIDESLWVHWKDIRGMEYSWHSDQKYEDGSPCSEPPEWALKAKAMNAPTPWPPKLEES